MGRVQIKKDLITEAIQQQISKQHTIGCWIALAVNIIWSVVNYFIFPTKGLFFSELGLFVSLIIFLSCYFRKRLNLSPQLLGMIPMTLMSVFFAFIYSYSNSIEVFQKFTFIYVAMFLGAGMFLLWEIKYSIITILIAFGANLLFFDLHNNLAINELFFNGGILVFSMALFMVISIERRYKLVLKEVYSTVTLKQSELELKKSEAQSMLLFNKNPRPMLIYNLVNLNILEVNDTMVDKYGYSKSELKNKSILDFRPEEDINKVLEDVEEVKGGVDKVSEWVHKLKNGQLINVEITAKNLDYYGAKARLVLIKDVTEEKRIKQKLEKLVSELEVAKDKAETAQKNQSLFLSNMSHEIRTPMNGILGMTRLIQKTELTPEQKKYSKAIFTSADNLMGIINEILDFSKIDAGKMSFEKVPFNLNDAILIWDQTLSIRANEDKVDFNIKLNNDVPTKLIGDPVRLNQIIYNLGGNALKFSKKGAVNIKIWVKEKNPTSVNLQFDVVDNGIGIPEDKLETIFSSFSQASTSTTRKYGGTGLGLTISKQLVELQGGKIWVESKEGEGSTFSFVMDFELLKEDNTKKAKNGKGILKNNKLGVLDVLLVEDHEINQLLATTVLEGWDFKVDLAENGEEAVEKVTIENYDIILMDIHMPKMDGYVATKQIREKLKCNTPIIALTASAQIQDNQKCFEAGMNDFISKPFDPDLLLEKITIQINKNK